MITVLSGGTGTPKLIQGLKNIVNPEDLSIIVNTLENDYFSGVYVSADIDTVLYTLADLINEEFWYGIKDDTFITHERLEEISYHEILRIGDKDRATKIQKTRLMEFNTLSEAVDIQRMNMNISSKVIPMSNEESEIKILTDIGELDFHDFLISEKCAPEVQDIIMSDVLPAPGVISAINQSDIVIIGPSNPITSILPIISIEGVREALKDAYVVAISPIVSSSPISGPANKFMKALGYEVSSKGVCEIYSEFLDKIIIDNQDENLVDDLKDMVGKVVVTNTIMKTIEDKDAFQLVLMKWF